MHKNNEAVAAIFASGGEMGTRIGKLDWSTTALGALDTWPQSLWSALSICLSTNYAIAIYWGPEHILLYNDAWARIIGDRHPDVLGRPAREVWADHWDTIGPSFVALFDQGESVQGQNEPLLLRRNGYFEECYFEYSFTPLRDDGGIVGAFALLVETSQVVIADRRGDLLQRLASAITATDSIEETCKAAAAQLADGSRDVPFCLVYLLETGSDRSQARLIAAAGLAPDSGFCPTQIDLNQNNPHNWPLEQNLAVGETVLVDELEQRFGGELRVAGFPEPVRCALIMPIFDASEAAFEPRAMVVLGVNPHQTADERYHNFAKQVADTLVEAIARVQVGEKLLHRDRLAHLHFLENLDRINRVMQREENLEDTLNAVLDEMLSIFGCDRAWLVFPCDPDAPTCGVPWQRTSPDYASPGPGSGEVPINQEIAQLMRLLIELGEPFQIGGSSPYPMPSVIRDISVQSYVAMAVIPRVGAPWMFGMHQCAYVREWTEAEKRLMQEIGARLGDCLSNLLAFRALADKERDFRLLAENLPDCVLRFDQMGRILYHNSITGRILPCPDGNIYGKNVSDLFPDQNHSVFEQALHQVFETGQDVELEQPAPDTDGGLRTYLLRLCPERGPDGIFRSVLAVGRDVTEQKRYEQNLLEVADQQQQLRQFFEVAPGYFFTMVKRADGSYVVTFASEGIRALIGLEPNVVVRDISAFSDLLHPDDRAMTFAKADESARDLTPYRLEYRAIHPVHGVRWIESLSQPQRTADGGTRWDGVMLDVTERKRMQEALAESQNFLHRVIESISDPVFVMDREHRWVLLNNAFCKFVGHPLEHLIGKTDFDFFPAHEAQLFWDNNEIIFTTGVENINEELITDYNGITHTIVTKKTCYTDDNGNLFLVGTIMDITERKQIESALKFVASRGWAAGESEFLPAVAEYVGQHLGVDHVIVDTLDEDPTFAQTEVIWSRGEFKPNMSYALTGTPCEDVLKGDTCVYPRDVQQRFPNDPLLAEMGCVSYAGVPLRGASGQVLGLISVMDCKPFANAVAVERLLQIVAIRAAAELERKRATEALQAREREFHSLAENTPASIIRYDREGRISYLNARMKSYLGFMAETDIVRRRSQEVWPDGRYRVVEEAMDKVLKSGKSVKVELAEQIETGGTRYHWIQLAPERDGNNAIRGAIAIGVEVTDLRNAQEELVLREREFRTLAEHSPDNIARYDCKGRIRYFNPQMIRNLGVLGDDYFGRRPSEYDPDGRFEELQQLILRVAATGVEAQFEMTMPAHGSMEKSIHHVRLVAERGSTGEVSGVLVLGRDITELMAYREKIQVLAFSDMLTGLPNRTLFNDRIQQVRNDAEREGHCFALMLIDLDQFKTINDTLGHAVGDQLLSQVAERLQNSVRSTDTVARIGGDEFAVILSKVRNGDDAGGIASEILNKLLPPFVMDHHELFATASIGISIYPSDSGNTEDLFRYADAALYEAKANGRNNFQFYERELTERATSRMRLEAELRYALARNELEVYYQPKIDLNSGHAIGAEALLRWNHPQRGLVPPDEFIGIAEDTGMIVEIGAWVLREACQMASRWNSCASDLHKIAVNLSPRQFYTCNDLAATVWKALEETDCRPEWIELEITESLLLGDQRDVKSTLQAFDSRGLSIAIDDFGTGYSALSYLNRFPIRTLKIDRTFIANFIGSPNATALVSAILAMGHSLHMDIVAEGVETRQQSEWLVANGCHYGQGYFWSKPLPADSFERFFLQGLERYVGDR